MIIFGFKEILNQHLQKLSNQVEFLEESRERWLPAWTNAEKNFKASLERIASLEHEREVLAAHVSKLESELETLAAHIGLRFQTVNGRQLVPTVAINKFQQ